MDYRNKVERMLTAYEARGCNMSLKVNFLHSHLDHLLENLVAYSDERGKRFHRDLRLMQKRFSEQMGLNKK